MAGPYQYGDWLSCPECNDSEIYVETIQHRSEEKPANVDGILTFLRFYCEGCGYLSQEFDPEKIFSGYQ